ncbi:MAG: ComEC/Rec2 family competence protein [Candidatus Omnitrophica bacterium]|nr:ComEC/Rec2 family competence protein [Candidatus Omnitrophota bacterium]
MEKRNPPLYFSSLVRIVLFFITGIIWRYFVRMNFFVLSFLIIFTLLFILLSFKKELINSNLILLLSFLSGALHWENAELVAKHNLRAHLEGGHRKVWLKLKVVSSVSRYKEGDKKRYDFFAKVIAFREEEKWISISGKVKAYLFGNEPEFAHGDILLCQGSLVSIKGPLSSDKFSALLFLKSDTVRLVKRSNHPLRYIFRLKDILSKKIDKHLPYPHKAILSALILGERRTIPKEIKENFIHTGTIHILAISGLHVGMIVYIFYLFLKLLRFPRQISLLLLIIFIIAYAIFTGANAPVVRAGIMTGIYLLGLILRKEGNVLNSLALACWIILIFDPYQLFNRGFQLSFLVVLAILLFTPLIEGYFFKKEGCVFLKKGVMKSYCLRLFSVSLSAWLGSAGLVGYYFKMINPIAVMANMLVVPLSFLVLATGIIFLFSFPPFTSPLMATHVLTTEILLRSIALLSKFPWGRISASTFSFSEVILYYLFLGLIIFLIRRKKLTN